ncbi:hypothetical protein C1894_01025 [Pseudomonas sp. FW305-3-2-15-E-TSA2]|nr:hypothetical protein C1895_06640 [Pseudomonas sp. FW305-3-2-15-E-TSA4]POA45819.1 hypothetical protein C1894_01025 [Pseudomonas sp. FW305-3-2-15-E-TSA2]
MCLKFGFPLFLPPQSSANPCGSEPARESGVPANNVLADSTPSRASPLPQGVVELPGDLLRCHVALIF